MSSYTGDLIEAVIAKLKAVSGVSDDNVVMGEIYDIETKDSSAFPFIQIVPLKDKGMEYYEQRDLQERTSFVITGHKYVASKDRESGADMLSIVEFGRQCRAALFGFMDDVQSGSPPTSGFLYVDPDYEIEYFYQLFTEKINTFVMEIGFIGQVGDITV